MVSSGKGGPNGKYDMSDLTCIVNKNIHKTKDHKHPEEYSTSSTSTSGQNMVSVNSHAVLNQLPTASTPSVPQEPKGSPTSQKAYDATGMSIDELISHFNKGKGNQGDVPPADVPLVASFPEPEQQHFERYPARRHGPCEADGIPSVAAQPS